jgi:hypothetical protein
MNESRKIKSILESVGKKKARLNEASVDPFGVKVVTCYNGQKFRVALLQRTSQGRPEKVYKFVSLDKKYFADTTYSDFHANIVGLRDIEPLDNPKVGGPWTLVEWL